MRFRSEGRAMSGLLRSLGIALLAGALAFAGPVVASAAEPSTNNEADNDVPAPQVIKPTDVQGLEGSYIFDGKPVEPEFKIVVGDVTLKRDVDYTVTIEKNDTVGTGIITITGKGSYSGTLELPFLIVSPTTYTVRFESNGGSAVAAESVRGGTTATKPTDPSRQGYSFQGWYTDQTSFKNSYDFSKPVTSDMTLYAKWTKATYTFVDVRHGDEENHASDIEWLANQGIAEGFLDSSSGKRYFRGMNDLARADMAAFLYRLAGSPAYEPSDAAKKAFTDVNDDTWHSKEIYWLYDSGVAEGFKNADGTASFRPMDSITRQDTAAFLHRLSKKTWGAGDTTLTKSPFTDVTVGDDVDHAGDVLWLAENDISTGFDAKDGKKEFRGLENVKRQDMAAFLHRTYVNVR